MKLTEKDIEDLKNKPHSFTYFKWVFNNKSASTQFRLYSNTSRVHNETTISCQQLTPKKILNNQETGIIRFRLYSVPLLGDVESAYHKIMVDKVIQYLRLFFYYKDPKRCQHPRIFKRICQEFGDTAAAIGLEVAMIKFIAVACLLIST